jgi:phosphoribosyl-AMP cyclohydrolase
MVELNFNKLDGLIPVTAQDYRTGEVLMMAFMNRDSWELTLKTGYAHYWSRSRDRFWKKGEVSGNFQEVREIRIDCDNDSVLIKVHQIGGAACHTGFRSCFYRIVKGAQLETDGIRVFNPTDVYGEE